MAVIAQTTGDEFWESEHAGVASVARHEGWRVYWNAHLADGCFLEAHQSADVVTGFQARVDGPAARYGWSLA